MEGYIRSRKIDILFFSFFSFLFKIIDRGILGVLRRTREECRFLGVVIVRFIQKARHSEDPRWLFPSDMKGDDGLYSQKSDFESVGLYRAEWSGASKGFRFLNTPACFLFQSLQPSCQWRRKLLFFSFFFSSLSENTKFRRRIVNFFSFFTSFILLSPL